MEVFCDSLKKLQQLNSKTVYLVNTTNSFIGWFKKQNKRFIEDGQSILKLQNQCIQLEYLIKLHIINSEVYQQLIEEGVVLDTDFLAQLEGMILVTNEYCKDYYDLSMSLKQIRLSMDRDKISA